jgi:hypothetical protein
VGKSIAENTAEVTGPMDDTNDLQRSFADAVEGNVAFDGEVSHACLEFIAGAEDSV